MSVSVPREIPFALAIFSVEASLPRNFERIVALHGLSARHVSIREHQVLALVGIGPIIIITLRHVYHVVLENWVEATVKS